MRARRGSVLIEAVVSAALFAAALVLMADGLEAVGTRARERRTALVQASAVHRAARSIEALPFTSFPPVGTALSYSFDTVAVAAIRETNRAEDGLLVPAFRIIVQDARPRAAGRTDTLWAAWNPQLTRGAAPGYNRQPGLEDLRP